MYSGYDTEFDSRSEFLFTNGSVDKSVFIFRVGMSSFLHLDNKGKYILIPDKGPTKALDDTTLTAEAQYSIKFSRSIRKFCWSLHYNESNSFLFVNATKIYQFKAKDSEIKKIPYI